MLFDKQLNFINELSVIKNNQFKYATITSEYGNTILY